MLLQERLSAVVALLCFLAVGKVSVTNLKNIYTGYYANYLVLQHNDAKIRECSERIQAGETVENVKLYQIPNIECACEMVYYPGFSFMIHWMNEYYNIPEEVSLDYEEISDIEVLRALDKD